MELIIKNSRVTADTIGKTVEFPKYTTQIMNLANQNAQGTRPNVVGQMSELIEALKELMTNGLNGILTECLKVLKMLRKRFMA